MKCLHTFLMEFETGEGWGYQFWSAKMGGGVPHTQKWGESTCDDSAPQPLHLAASLSAKF